MFPTNLRLQERVAELFLITTTKFTESHSTFWAEKASRGRFDRQFKANAYMQAAAILNRLQVKSNKNYCSKNFIQSQFL